VYFQLLWVVGGCSWSHWEFKCSKTLAVEAERCTHHKKNKITLIYWCHLVQSVTFFRNWMILLRLLRRTCAQRSDMYVRFPRHLNFKTSWSGKLDSLYSPSVDKSCTTQTEVVTDHIYRYYLQNRINLNFSISLIHKRRARTQFAVGLALLKQSQKLMCPHGTNL